MKFFSSSMRLHVVFFALQHSAGIFFCVDGVEKVGFHYCCSLRSQQSYLTQIGA